jgi:hypothetical protein
MSKNQFPIVGKWGKYWCALAAIYAIAVVIYIFTETGKPLGARDFHQFWYAGHFIIQRMDPYEAFFRMEQPRLPVRYLDGVVVNQYPVAQPKLEITPSNTPTMLVFLSPVAILSWNHAKWLFMVLNFLLMLGTGWLVLRRVPFGNIRLTPLEELLIFLAYFDLSATRIAIENGQTTLLVFLLMLVAIIEVDHAWHISGISLGLALSKYSLSLPIFLFFLYKKKYKTLFFAVFVQMVGILVLSEITTQSPVTIIYENIMLFFRLFDQPGVHLSRWFEFLSTNHFVAEVPVLLMTMVVFALILLWARRSNRFSAYAQSILDFHILTILLIWTMLAAYHRLYDTLVVIFFMVLLFKGLHDPSIWNLSARERKVLMGLMMVLPFVLILPARIVDKVLPEYYGRTSDAVTTATLVLLFGISMFLLRRSLQSMQKLSFSTRRDANDIQADSQRDTQPRWANYSQPSSGAKRT